MAFAGSRLAAARAAAGLTQERLAQLLATDQSRVSEWERGVMAPRPNLIPRIASAVDVDALALLGADPAAPSLEDMRLAAGLTMSGVAALAGVSLRRYRGIEIGATRREPPEQLVTDLARIFAVPTVTVLAGIDSARS